MVRYRTCTDCMRFEKTEFPALQKAAVDTRVIMSARPDKTGVERSTPAERATVAELWANRRWALQERPGAQADPDLWQGARHRRPPTAIPVRTALVDASRKLVADPTLLVKKNGIELRLSPAGLVGPGRDDMRGCVACESAKTYRFIEKGNWERA